MYTAKRMTPTTHRSSSFAPIGIEAKSCSEFRAEEVGTTANKFRVRGFQSSLAPANASSDPGKSQGARWPQPSMPSPLRQVYLDVKGERSEDFGIHRVGRP